MLTIGFATEFYTLWDVVTEPKYFIDSYGNHHLSGYTTHYWYIKNISKDLDSAKAKHPDLAVDEDLKGITRSWEKSTTTEDLTPEILKFGKYSGRSIREVSETDFGYILWLLENSCSATRTVCAALPKVVEYFAEIERVNNEKMSSHPTIESGVLTINFLSNPNKELGESVDTELFPNLIVYERKYYATASIGNGNTIYVIFDSVKMVGGKYPYNMAIINGNAMKLKGKAITLDLEVLATNRGVWGVHQFVIVK